MDLYKDILNKALKLSTWQKKNVVEMFNRIMVTNHYPVDKTKHIIELLHTNNTLKIEDVPPALRSNKSVNAINLPMIKL